MQSPKSKRAHAPSETPAVDNNPQTKSGGSIPRQPSDQAKSKAHVPEYGSKGGFKGGVQSGSSTVSTHGQAPSQAGRPGYVSPKGR